MTTQNIGLFKALNAKMDFLNQRQRVISQNVANADTPGYRPQDMVPVDFSDVLKTVTKSNAVHMERTSEGHLPPPGSLDSDDPLRQKKQRETYEVAPVGNAVVMEEQLIKAGRNVMDYNLMASLYKKNMGMLKTAIGAGQ